MLSSFDVFYCVQSVLGIVPRSRGSILGVGGEGSTSSNLHNEWLCPVEGLAIALLSLPVPHIRRATLTLIDALDDVQQVNVIQMTYLNYSQGKLTQPDSAISI